VTRTRFGGLTPAVSIIGGAAILIAAVGSALVIGETSIPFSTIWNVLKLEAGYPAPEVNPIDHGILWSYRLPRAILAMACGTSLALSGIILQALLRNPLADPYILGLSAGASTGAVAVAILGLGAGALTLSGGAFIGALLAFGFVAWLARLASGNSPGATSSLALLLAGVAGAQLFHALTALIIAKSADANQARGIMFWMMGNLSGSRWPDVYLAVPIAMVGAGVIFAHFRALDAMTFGREAAQSMGIRTGLVMTILIGTAALLTAVMVSLGGHRLCRSCRAPRDAVPRWRASLSFDPCDGFGRGRVLDPRRHCRTHSHTRPNAPHRGGDRSGWRTGFCHDFGSELTCASRLIPFRNPSKANRS